MEDFGTPQTRLRRKCIKKSITFCGPYTKSRGINCIVKGVNQEYTVPRGYVEIEITKV